MQHGPANEHAPAALDRAGGESLTFRPGRHRWSARPRRVSLAQADLHVIDYDQLRLSTRTCFTTFRRAGARRITQGARGYEALVVAGQVVSRAGEPTGALPGRLVRAAAVAELSRLRPRITRSGEPNADIETGTKTCSLARRGVLTLTLDRRRAQTPCPAR